MSGPLKSSRSGSKWIARRLPVIEPEETAQTRVDQLNRVIRLMVDCVTKMRLTGPPDKEIAVLLRAAADELDQ
jgi:hypothetical protein